MLSCMRSMILITLPANAFADMLIYSACCPDAAGRHRASIARPSARGISSLPRRNRSRRCRQTGAGEEAVCTMIYVYQSPRACGGASRAPVICIMTISFTQRSSRQRVQQQPAFYFKRYRSKCSACNTPVTNGMSLSGTFADLIGRVTRLGKMSAPDLFPTVDVQKPTFSLIFIHWPLLSSTFLESPRPALHLPQRQDRATVVELGCAQA